MQKRKHNPKRRITPAVSIGVTKQLLEDVMYAGNPAHKRIPGDFGLTPPASPRSNKTLCDVTNIEFAEALELLRKGVERGLISVQTRSGYPQNIWAVSRNGYALEAQLENVEKGTYHGYPMTLEDPLAIEVKKRWSGNSQ